MPESFAAWDRSAGDQTFTAAPSVKPPFNPVSPDNFNYLRTFDDLNEKVRRQEDMKNTGWQYAREPSCSTLGLRSFIGLLCCCAALGASAYAQQVLNFDDITTGWQQCTGPSCAGGSGNPTSTSQTFGNATPSLDAGSMLLSESGPASSNNGWFYNAGKMDTATGFTLDLEFNIASNTDIQALEFDQFQYLKAPDGGVTANTRLFFGTECVTGGVWNVWDSSGIGWVSTGVTCSYVVSSTAFNHLTITVHRVAGDTSCVNGYPCMYYSITFNGASIVSNAKTNSGALPSTFGEQTGFMIQLDTSSACSPSCTISEYIDKGNFLATNMPWWPAVQQMLQD